MLVPQGWYDFAYGGDGLVDVVVGVGGGWVEFLGPGLDDATFQEAGVELAQWSRVGGQPVAVILNEVVREIDVEYGILPDALDDETLL